MNFRKRSDPVYVARLTNAGQRTGRAAVLFGRVHAALVRRRLFARWFGAPVLVLETVGRRSGQPRATPVVYVREGASFVVCAAAGGTRTPAWWLNLRASGEGVAVVHGRRTRVRPRVPAGDERARLWERYLGVYPAAAAYVEMAGREFPLVVLDPA